LRDELLRSMDAVEPSLTPDDPLAKVIRYYRNHWQALFRFVDDPELPIDNSASEREYQNVAKLRLNSLFAGSTEGAHRAATLLGIAATCRTLGIDTQAYLAWALQWRTRRGSAAIWTVNCRACDRDTRWGATGSWTRPSTRGVRAARPTDGSPRSPIGTSRFAAVHGRRAPVLATRLRSLDAPAAGRRGPP